MRVLVAISGALFVAGCGQTQVDTVRARGANDFRCPAEQVVVGEPAGTSYTVEGCGKRATYTCVSPIHNVCVREGDVETTGVSTPAVAPQPSGPTSSSAPSGIVTKI